MTASQLTLTVKKLVQSCRSIMSLQSESSFSLVTTTAAAAAAAARAGG